MWRCFSGNHGFGRPRVLTQNAQKHLSTELRTEGVNTTALKVGKRFFQEATPLSSLSFKASLPSGELPSLGVLAQNSFFLPISDSWNLHSNIYFFLNTSGFSFLELWRWLSVVIILASTITFFLSVSWGFLFDSRVTLGATSISLLLISRLWNKKGCEELFDVWYFLTGYPLIHLLVFGCSCIRSTAHSNSTYLYSCKDDKINTVEATLRR